MQVSHSKKWASRPVLDASGNPMRTKSGKIVLRKSYSVLQDRFHDHMFAAGFTDVQRGERGSTEEHLTTVQFKVMKEEETLTTLWLNSSAPSKLPPMQKPSVRKRNMKPKPPRKSWIA